MNAPTSLESRLSAALNARADLLTPESLTPGSVPATVSPLRRRTRQAAAAGAVIAVAASALVGFSLLGDGDDSSAPGFAPQPTVSDTANPTPAPDPEPTTDAPPVSDPDGLDELLPQDPIDFVEPGESIPLRDGATAVVEGDRLLVDGIGDGQLGGDLEGIDPAVALDVTTVSLGQAGVGFLVSQTEGGESYAQELYVIGDGNGLVRAAPTGDVRFGTSYTEGFPEGYITWTTGDGANLFTRFQQGGPDGAVWVVYRWEVTGPGEGGGPEAAARDLVPTNIGTACFDLATNVSKAC